MDGMHVGQRMREIRQWRGLSLLVAAELAGISKGYLSKLETNQKPVTNRNVLESVARALRVSPSEFDGRPWERPRDPELTQAHAGVVAFEVALASYELGEDPGGPLRAWEEITADTERLADLMYVSGDYAGQVELAPRLLAELHALYVREPIQRREVLRALIVAYSSAAWVSKRFGGRGLALLAAKAVQDCADLLESPQWRGYAAWLRGDVSGGLSRELQYRRVVAMADELRPSLDHDHVVQAYGMLNLSAAWAAAAQKDRDTANTHLAEAATVATRLDTEVGSFGRLWFGTVNVGVWRTAIATEFGDGVAVTEIARNVTVEAIPSPSRRAEYYADCGRAMLPDKATHTAGLELILRAETLAPQRVRADVFIREAVAAELRRARRDAGGRELRGLAWRIGIAPNG